MSTPPPSEISVYMKKEVPEFTVNISFDPETLMPIRPDGITDEQFKQGCPDEKTERYLQYLRGIKNREQPDQSIISVVDLHAEGYPQLAAAINSDERFMFYRRFGFLQTRLLLNKQDELRALEARLDHKDRYYGKYEPAMLYSQERFNITDDDNRNLLAEIEKKFNEYGQLLTHARTLASFDKPRESDRLRLRDYSDSNPLCYRDSEWLLRKDDHITLKPTRDNTWLDTVIEQIPQYFPCRLTRYIFCTTVLRQKTNPETTKIFLSDPDRVNAIASLVLLTTVLALFVIPVCILWYLCQMSILSPANIGTILAILLPFTFIFSVVISLFTRAKRHEVLATAAAYCALLILSYLLGVLKS
ncbi:uncharacterized protein EAE97_011178 [Botrytis byssoidea]|uniref:DUF6594 domain-containing protein n=1 Tax=Botrytis byssoidea TaxID=139641 RepID=A0A9P5HVQ9_9HELO|nr:uncharacterized protein EAE97_011178 [Botrytis byssoidea]KAF7921887.1 hypothetical protein EAE97_011178 [Botrytis byssoidea]